LSNVREGRKLLKWVLVERLFFLEGGPGINIRLGRKTLQKEV
jgi:hypothetical protein